MLNCIVKIVYHFFINVSSVLREFIPFGTEACACLDTSRRQKRKIPRASSHSGFCTGIGSALQGFRHGSGGAMFRTQHNHAMRVMPCRLRHGSPKQKRKAPCLLCLNDILVHTTVGGILPGEQMISRMITDNSHTTKKKASGKQVRESAPSYKVSTRDDGAEIRTQSVRRSHTGEFDSKYGPPDHKKEKHHKRGAFLWSGDPYGNRTHVTAVKGPCLSRLTNGPYERLSAKIFGG